MGIFDKVFGSNSTNVKLTEREAFVAISLMIAGADGSLGEEEINTASLGLVRMKMFAGNPPPLERVYHTVVKRNSAGPIIEAAKNALSPELRETAFAFATDIALSDGYLDVTEKDHLTQLYQGLEIPEELAGKIIEVIQIKNRG